MFSRTILRFGLINLALRTAGAVSTCYFPSGAIATGNVPCNNGVEFSSCCGGLDNCLANGLCLVNSNPDTFEFGRGGCTDPTWSSSNCFQHCKTTPSGDLMTNGAAVFECDATGYANPAQYCCETGPYQKTSCCSNQALRFNLGSGTPTGVQIVLGGDGGGGGGGLSTSASTPVPLPPSPTSPSSTHSAMKSAVISQPIATTTLIMSVTPPISQQPTTSSSEVGSGSHDTLQSPTSSTKSTSKTSPTLTFSKNPSTTDNGQNSNNSSSQAEGAAQTSLGTSSNVTPINTGISEAAKVAIGVAVPVAILLAALLGFLLWNNHRNSKRIRSLQSDLSTSRSPKPPLIDIIPPASCPSVHSFPTALMAEIDAGGRLATTKTFPGYPRYEYYKPQPQLRPMHEMGGDSNPQELPIWTRRPHELDSTPMISHHPQGFS